MPTNEELQNELAELRAQVRQLAAAMTVTTNAEQEPRVLSRRNLLRAAPVVAVGAGIAALRAAPAAATAGQPLVLGADNDAGSAGTTLVSTSDIVLGVLGGLDAVSFTMPGQGIAGQQVKANVTDGFQIAGQVEAPAALTVGGVILYGGEVVYGNDAVRVYTRGAGVGVTVNIDDFGEEHPSGHSDGSALLLTTDTCDVIDATTAAGHVVKAAVTSKTCAIDAVTVSYAGTSRAVYAESTATNNVNGTITGVNDGAGIGVWGENKNATAAGFGVVGVGNKAGRGGRFSGGAASLQMLPSTATTHPSTGKAGDFFVDSTARLWYCQKASSATAAATWKQLA